MTIFLLLGFHGKCKRHGLERYVGFDGHEAQRIWEWGRDQTKFWLWGKVLIYKNSNLQEEYFSLFQVRHFYKKLYFNPGLFFDGDGVIEDLDDKSGDIGVDDSNTEDYIDRSVMSFEESVQEAMRYTT